MVFIIYCKRRLETGKNKRVNGVATYYFSFSNKEILVIPRKGCCHNDFGSVTQRCLEQEIIRVNYMFTIFSPYTCRETGSSCVVMRPSCDRAAESAIELCYNF